jgi:release factor glutamine methyltransferase
MPATLGQALSSAARRLTKAGCDAPVLDAQVLAADVLEKSRAFVLAHPELLLTPGQERRFAALVGRRESREPLAYILGRKEFYGRDFLVGPGVLAPRPETEGLVELALERVPPRGGAVFADLGTGSGILAVTLACERPGCLGFALDICDAALSRAVENARRHEVEDRLLFVGCDFARDCLAPGSLDLVLANPPYLTTAELAQAPDEVRAFEPPLALDGGRHGLAAVLAVERAAARALVPGGLLLLEIGEKQGEAVRRAFVQSNVWSGIRVEPDLAGRDRVFWAVRSGG